MNEINKKEIKEKKLKTLEKEIKTLDEEEIKQLREVKEKEIIYKKIKKELIISQEKLNKIHLLKSFNYECIKDEIEHNYYSYNKKEIRIIYSLSGNTVILKSTINIISHTLSRLYKKICYEIKKPNISKMIINQYEYTLNEYSENDESSLEDTCLERRISSIVPSIECYLLELFNKDYNEDYIEVLLIFSSCIHYIKKLVDDFKCSVRRDTVKNRYAVHLKLYQKIFGSRIRELDNNCLSLDDYNKIVLYIIENIELENDYQYILENIKSDYQYVNQDSYEVHLIIKDDDFFSYESRAILLNDMKDHFTFE